MTWRNYFNNTGYLDKKRLIAFNYSVYSSRQRYYDVVSLCMKYQRGKELQPMYYTITRLFIIIYPRRNVVRHIRG